STEYYSHSPVTWLALEDWNAISHAAEDARDAAEDAREAAAARTADPETGPLPAAEVVRPINGGPGRP
ncbi:hypothetical protein JRG61_11975, partial [Micrococcus luteus]|nr:hypothetical protein [Micrococcus luteus]